MKCCKKILSLALACCMTVATMVAGQTTTHASSDPVKDHVANMIAYYRDYKEGARTDILRNLEGIRKVNPDQADAWTKIMDYWNFVNTDMKVNIGVTQDGLPQDDSMAIIILGFALNEDGTMKEELVNRLKAGLASAEKYPNAYVVVTGGGTAKNNPDVTEGGLMGEWLLEQGLNENRLIVEDKAPNTVGNALNTFEILTTKYPQVKSVVMVTSDYHVPRASILFYSKFVLAALESGKQPLNIVANAGCETGSQGYESIQLQADGVANVAGVTAPSEKLPLSQLTALSVKQNTPYNGGDTLDVTVTAQYDTDFSRDVTGLAQISGFDPAKGPGQTVTVTYQENGQTATATLKVEGQPVEQPQEPAPTPEVPATSAPEVTPDANQKPVDQVPQTGDTAVVAVYVVALVAAAALLIGAVVVYKRRHN